MGMNCHHSSFIQLCHFSPGETEEWHAQGEILMMNKYWMSAAKYVNVLAMSFVMTV